MKPGEMRDMFDVKEGNEEQKVVAREQAEQSFHYKRGIKQDSKEIKP